MVTHYKIKARDILEDIRLGLTDEELMDKFEMPKESLQIAFDQLVQAGLVTKHQLRSRAASVSEIDESDVPRKLPRHFLVVRIGIHELDNPSNSGTIRDLSETGIGIVGIRAVMDDVQRLLIPPNDLNLAGEISFEAKCRWTRVGTGQETLCGYQIVAIEDEGLDKLRFLIQGLTFDDQL